MLAPDDDLLVQCIHCGMCLATCPTYALTLRERSSPRGRIRLIRAVAEGRLAASPVFAHEMFFCLDCRACETACPAGARYGKLVESARESILANRRQTSKLTALRLRLLSALFRKQARLRWLARLIRLYQKSGLESLLRRTHALRLLSKKFDALIALTPHINAHFSTAMLPEILPAQGEQRYRVALLTGCVQDVAFAEVNRHTAEVLAYNGCEVWIPRGQSCCGSLHGHIGDRAAAQEFARRIMEIFGQHEFDAVITNAAGCGSFMKDYATLCNDGDQSAAADFAGRVADIHEFLVRIGFRRPEHHVPARVTYHDACHLAHAQKITAAPREILKSIPGVEFVELGEANWCCGSAGVYNVVHTETAMQLLARKMEHVRKTGAAIVASANPGCSIQIAAGVRKYGLDMDVVHPISLLHAAYGLR